MDCQKKGFDVIALNVTFQGPKGQTKVKFVYFATFWQYSQNRSDPILTFVIYLS